ncbi:MAG TPA: selenide, water dikinase SelD [Candidatus Limnocylindria bacterium]|jgi:selenide,water dikinase|nr:selenide, water dikinase SelD [Candidatus Limnocylindria bacterium]
MGPGDLQDVLGGLRAQTHPDLLVGLDRSDDAAVYRVSEEVAIVETVDFFPPIVDDPYTYGAIAAVNAMSDVYAMGGEVLFALNVAGFPRELPKPIIAAIFRGGADKVREAGGIIAGGHTVVDAEPKYGLCVTGRVHPARILVKGGLEPGQRVFLSKPLGTGVIATAAKEGACDPAVLEGAVRSMLRLNRGAAAVARESGATAATDVTGFGLLGHLGEMVDASGVGVHLRAKDLPVLPGALSLAEKGHWSGGMKRNRRHLDATLGRRRQLALDPALPEALVGLLFESETSGGLIFGVAPERAAAVRDGFDRLAEPCWEIGEVTEELRIGVA